MYYEPYQLHFYSLFIRNFQLSLYQLLHQDRDSILYLNSIMYCNYSFYFRTKYQKSYFYIMYNFHRLPVNRRFYFYQFYINFHINIYELLYYYLLIIHEYLIILLLILIIMKHCLYNILPYIFQKITIFIRKQDCIYLLLIQYLF